MKYLRSFNESFDESNIDVEKVEDILLNVRDILLPISDMGYNIVVDGCFNAVANAPI